MKSVAVQTTRSLIRADPTNFEFSCHWDSRQTVGVQSNIPMKALLGVPNIPQINFKSNATSSEEKKNFCQIPTKRVIETVRRTSKKPCLIRGLDFSGVDRSLISGECTVQNFCGIEKIVYDTYLGIIGSYMSPIMTNRALLVLFFTRLKLGLSETCLEILFGVERSSISSAFLSTLQIIYERTSDLLTWPKHSGTRKLPKTFSGFYRKTRIILIFLEMDTQLPELDCDTLEFYSDGRYSLKCILGVTPMGKVCFQSNVHKGDVDFLTIVEESGILDLLRPGNLVLTNTHLPGLESILPKNVRLVVPSQFNANGQLVDDQDVYVMAHIDRCIRRIKSFKILQDIPETLIDYADKIVHVCCTIMNHMPHLGDDVS